MNVVSGNYLLNGRFSYFFSDNKNIGLDFTYVNFKDKFYSDGEGNFYPYGKQTFYDVLANLQIGTFDSKNVVDVYLNLGLGVHFENTGSYEYSYYSFYDSTYYTYNTPSYFSANPLIQFGGGLIIKPAKNIGINFEIDMKAYNLYYFLIPTQAYFPVKAGISYYFFK